jgi:hypothetical protein
MDILPMVIVGTVMAAGVMIVRSISDNWTRRKALDAHASDDVVRTIFTRRRDPDTYGALKWGLVVAAVGIALMVVQFLPYNDNDPIAFGIVLLFAGAGLLAYYAMARRVAPQSWEPAPHARTEYDPGADGI